MASHNLTEPLWQRTGAGLYIPVGWSSESSESSSHTYLKVKESAEIIEQIYADNAVPLHSSSGLARLIAHTKLLSDTWLMDKEQKNVKDLLASTAFLNRIADAIQLLVDVPTRIHYLSVFTSGNLDIHARNPSRAKDILWEVELWSVLRRRGFSAELQEPDIVINFEDAKIGIACKKIYSNRNVGKVISEAVGQIEAIYSFGILALNLDDLLAPSQILQAKTQEQMADFLSNLNAEFLVQHKRHVRKYLTAGRLISVLVSTSTLADVQTMRVRFNVARQSTVWTVPGLPEEKEKQLSRFYTQLMH